MEYYFHEKSKYVDLVLSSGCNAMMSAEDEYNDVITGGWSMAGNILTLVWEFNIDGYPQYDSWQYTLEQVNNNAFTLTDTYDPYYTYKILFRRL
jgi:hypothetical protein